MDVSPYWDCPESVAGTVLAVIGALRDSAVDDGGGHGRLDQF